MVGRGGGDDVRLVFSFSFVDLLLPLLVASVLVVISGYLLLGFPHVDHAKTSRFCSFPDKNEHAAKIELKKKARKAWYLRHFRKTYQKSRTKNIGKRKHRHIVLLTKTSQNTTFS